MCIRDRRYTVQISSVAGLLSNVQSSVTFNMSADFINLLPGTTYYGKVWAVNHGGLAGNYLLVGSTRTKDPNYPTELGYSTATVNSLTATWVAPTLAGET